MPGSDKMQRRDYKWATTPRIICICNTNTNWIKVFQQNTSTREKCLPFPECSMVVFLNSMFVHCPMIIPTSGYCPSVHYLSPISPCWWPCHHHVTKASPMPPRDTTLCSMTRPMRRESLCPGRAFVLGIKRSKIS